MKLMNHVRAGVAGTVLEVFARNNELVEHGQPLMSVAVDRALTTAIEASSTPAA
jgi:multidrug resistance efflux pump